MPPSIGPLSIAIQMDPIEDIDIRGDSTFALALEAQQRGHRVFVYTPDNLTMSLAGNTAITVKGCFVTVRDMVGGHVTMGAVERHNITDFAVVLMRQDPPFDLGYITATHILEHIHPKVLVVNNPKEVRNAPEKLLITHFPELLPPSLISRSPDDIRAFRRTHKNIIIKPLFGNGGAGVFHLKPDDDNLSVVLEVMLAADPAPLMIQKYLSAVRGGDKRVMLIDGVAVAALNRIPPKGETRSNMHVGGVAHQSDLDADDYRIAEVIGPILKEKDLLFAGIDVIGGYLTEINVTSPTGIREIKRFSDIDVAAIIWDQIEARF